MNVQNVEIELVKPYKRNPRKNDSAVDAVAASIREFGFQQPIVCDLDGVVIVGHTRLKAAKKLGLATVPVVYADLPSAKVKAYRLADNKTAELADWDLDLLDLELGDIEMEMEPFGFEDGGQNEWFDRKQKDGASREEGNEEYNEFLDKFEPKKTTDDCYTPELVYEAVADWVAKEYGVKRKDFVRPFYPGGDYQAEKYKPGAVVVDNPPFSILAEIVNFYADKGIRFFLFAPTMTLFSSSSSSSSACSLCVGVDVTYENNATVHTSFLTNMEPGCRLRSAPTLYTAVNEANKENLKATRRELPKYSYPDYVVTSTRVGQFSQYGIDYRVGVDESSHVRQLDAQKDSGKTIFGSGYLVCEKKKDEKVEAEREKAEREKTERWKLSKREMEIVKSLG